MGSQLEATAAQHVVSQDSSVAFILFFFFFFESGLLASKVEPYSGLYLLYSSQFLVYLCIYLAEAKDWCPWIDVGLSSGERVIESIAL